MKPPPREYLVDVGVHADTKDDGEALKVAEYLLENFQGRFSWRLISRGEKAAHLEVTVTASSTDAARFHLEDQLRLPGLTYHWYLLKPVREKT